MTLMAFAADLSRAQARRLLHVAARIDPVREAASQIDEGSEALMHLALTGSPADVDRIQRIVAPLLERLQVVQDVARQREDR